MEDDMTMERIKKALDILFDFKKYPLPSQYFIKLIENEFSEQEAREILDVTLFRLLEVMQNE
jgi:hypothetical protein